MGQSVPPNGGSGSAPELFSSLQLDEALKFAEDVFDRANIVFFLLGDTAIQVHDNGKLDQLPEITLGVVKTDWGEIQQRLFRTAMEFLGKEWKDTGTSIEFENLGVPIRTKVFKKHRRFFGNLDNIFYNYTQYLIPNQFEKYRKMRNLMR